MDLEDTIVRLARGVIENRHPTDVETPAPHPRVCMSIHPEGKSRSDLVSSALFAMTLLPIHPEGSSCSYIGSSACSQRLCCLELATDMKQHFTHIKTLKTVVEQQKKTEKTEKDKVGGAG